MSKESSVRYKKELLDQIRTYSKLLYPDVVVDTVNDTISSNDFRDIEHILLEHQLVRNATSSETIFNYTSLVDLSLQLRVIKSAVGEVTTYKLLLEGALT